MSVRTRFLKNEAQHICVLSVSFDKIVLWPYNINNNYFKINFKKK